jgi:hypothetical protein
MASESAEESNAFGHSPPALEPPYSSSDEEEAWEEEEEEQEREVVAQAENLKQEVEVGLGQTERREQQWQAQTEHVELQTQVHQGQTQQQQQQQQSKVAKMEMAKETKAMQGEKQTQGAEREQAHGNSQRQQQQRRRARKIAAWKDWRKVASRTMDSCFSGGDTAQHKYLANGARLLELLQNPKERSGCSRTQSLHRAEVCQALIGLSMTVNGLRRAMASQCTPAARKVRTAISISRAFVATSKSKVGGTIEIGPRDSMDSIDRMLLHGMVSRYRRQERQEGDILRPQSSRPSDLISVLHGAANMAALAAMAAHDAAVACWLASAQLLHRQLVDLLQREAQEEEEAKIATCTRLQTLVLSAKLDLDRPADRKAAKKITLHASQRSRSPKQLMALFEQPSCMAPGCCCANGRTAARGQRKHRITALALATIASTNLARASWPRCSYEVQCDSSPPSAATNAEDVTAARDGVRRVNGTPSSEELECVMTKASALGLSPESGLMKAALRAQRRIQVCQRRRKGGGGEVLSLTRSHRSLRLHLAHFWYLL